MMGGPIWGEFVGQRCPVSISDSALVQRVVLLCQEGEKGRRVNWEKKSGPFGNYEEQRGVVGDKEIGLRDSKYNKIYGFGLWV